MQPQNNCLFPWYAWQVMYLSVSITFVHQANILIFSQAISKLHVEDVSQSVTSLMHSFRHSFTFTFSLIYLWIHSFSHLML